jgi:hypothetical protein
MHLVKIFRAVVSRFICEKAPSGVTVACTAIRTCKSKEAVMNPPALLCLAALMISTIIALGGPAHARSDWPTVAAPHWLDQTVYRPNCLPADCACDCRSERLCLPACVRW